MKKTAFISVIGASNVGKSTLVNGIVGQKVSIVTHKVQTTRDRIIGIVIEGSTELIFTDTPGIFKTDNIADKKMVREAWSSLEEADFLAIVVDVKRGICSNTKTILKNIKDRHEKKILVLNKIDLVKKNVLLKFAQELSSSFDEIFMISATDGSGVNDLKCFFAENARVGEWPYPEDQVSDIPVRKFAEEITREKLLLRLNQELPYKLSVETEGWNETVDSITINQVIYITNESHKGIIVGKGGSTIRYVGEKSRKELSKLFDKTVHLFLFVKIKKQQGI